MFRVDYKPSLQRKMDREDGYEDGFADGKSAGFMEGETVGFTKGETAGFTKGETAGFVKGDTERQKQIVKNMLAHGIPEEEILMLTECSRELIEELRK